MNPDQFRHPSSFRDPAGYIFMQDDIAYRAIAPMYTSDYRQLMDSGLYNELTRQENLIIHSEQKHHEGNKDGWKIILPEQIAFWSYPYEWSFNQLKAAALLTLQVNLTALQHSMMLKDASAYNIQWQSGQPIFIDTLSFQLHTEGEPWKAFNQFCRHFLYPLLLLKHTSFDARILQVYTDGIPASMVKDAIPAKEKWNLNYWLYTHLPAKMEQKPQQSGKTYQISKTRIIQNLTQLQQYISNLNLPHRPTAWNDYYTDTILSAAYLSYKEQLVSKWTETINFSTACDLGCNTGSFTRIAARKATHVWAIDGDAFCINDLYKEVQGNKMAVTPLIADLFNPPPATGWNNAEHKPLLDRIGADLVMALALIHHLCLAGNASLTMVAGMMQKLCGKYLIIEFVPKEDPKAQLLLAAKGDIFPSYTQTDFEAAFAPYFTILRQQVVDGSKRTLYLLERSH